MNHLGNVYIYGTILIILLILLSVTISNFIYFSDLEQDNSESLTTTQAEQLTALNILTAFLLGCAFIACLYMSFKSCDEADRRDALKITAENKLDAVKIKQNKEKENMYKRSLENSNRENKALSVQIKQLYNQMNKEDDLNEKMSLRNEIQVHKKNKKSIFYE